jgi:6-phosphofructokinase 1
MDRVRAVRFAFRSLEHIETYGGMDPDEICDDPMSTAVIGIKGAKVLFSPMETVEKKVGFFFVF